MRLFEALLLLADVTACGVLVVHRPRSTRWTGYLAVVAVLLAGVQILIEGQRWQMVPAYSVTAALAVLWLAGLPLRTPWRSTGRRLISGVGAGLIAVGLIVAIVLPLQLPVFGFSPPTGRYAIGTTTYHWVDITRPELFTADPNDHRELMVQVWYPAENVKSSKRAPYLQPGTNLEATARLAHLPTFFFDHLRYVTTNAEPSTPVAADQSMFPVLVMGAGRGGYRQNSTFQVEELVSHGYIVAAIDHPYTSGDVVFPDGRHVEMDSRVLDSTFNQNVSNDTFGFNIAEVLGRDAAFTLDQLTTLEKDDPNGILTGRLDLEHVGALGASLGGFTAAEACLLDTRFKACLALDVAMPHDVVRSGLSQPTMMIDRGPEMLSRADEGWSAADTREEYASDRAVFASARGDAYLTFISGMFHADVADTPAILPPPAGRWLGATGPKDWNRTHEIINAYSLAFFDKYLKGEPESLLTGAMDQFPDATTETRHP